MEHIKSVLRHHLPESLLSVESISVLAHTEPNTLGLVPKTLKCVGWGATALVLAQR
ncbi:MULTISPECIES: hypothetical protein [unclassified Nostoc]|uniref:hypothetical protein n=1 Tax=unclassified Nostoc TaxID=2593658 RepID=UPI002AD92DA1|nr:hypothetical protein [Nostoc sp. DedQUE02]